MAIRWHTELQGPHEPYSGVNRRRIAHAAAAVAVVADMPPSTDGYCMIDRAAESVARRTQRAPYTPSQTARVSVFVERMRYLAAAVAGESRKSSLSNGLAYDLMSLVERMALEAGAADNLPSSTEPRACAIALERWTPRS